MPDIDAMRDRVRNRLVRGARWYDISNADDTDTAVLRVYDEISSWWGLSADDFARDLAAVTAPAIEVQISSPGGDVFDGVAIFNALRAHPARITTRVDGVAASIASVIAQAGDHRVMLGGAQMMIHQAWGVAAGSAPEIREFADLLDRQNTNIANIYAARSGEKSAEEFADLLASGDTWLSAAEAVEMGLADEVIDPEPKGKPAAAARPAPAASVEFKVDGNLLTRLEQLVEQTEQALAAMQNTQTPPAEPEDLTSSEVTSEQAERLLASITMKEK